jgi:hypothetical protein
MRVSWRAAAGADAALRDLVGDSNLPGALRRFAKDQPGAARLAPGRREVLVECLLERRERIGELFLG